MHGHRKENESYQQFGTGDGELVLNGYRGLVWEGEKIQETDGGDGCPKMYLMPLKNG